MDFFLSFFNAPKKQEEKEHTQSFTGGTRKESPLKDNLIELVLISSATSSIATSNLCA